jgi:hypothetical protein
VFRTLEFCVNIVCRYFGKAASDSCAGWELCLGWSRDELASCKEELESNSVCRC